MDIKEINSLAAKYREKVKKERMGALYYQKKSEYGKLGGWPKGKPRKIKEEAK
jgi:hypothetical protein